MRYLYLYEVLKDGKFLAGLSFDNQTSLEKSEKLVKLLLDEGYDVKFVKKLKNNLLN